jgi:hypothetical protein
MGKSLSAEVLVQPGQLVAVRRLVTSVVEGRFDLGETQPGVGTPVPLAIPAIPIVAIEVPDASAAARLEPGGR